MTSLPYFSVIIPTLNEKIYLPKLLKDLTQQSLKDFEVIIADAKSTDGTSKLVEKFRGDLPTLTLISSAKRNVSYQRNLGAKKAKGKYVLFIDADSRLPSFFLEGINYNLHKTPADLFTTWLKPDSTNSQDVAAATVVNLAYETMRLLDAPIGVGAMLGFKKTVFKKLGGFDETTSYAEDQQLLRHAVEKNYRFNIYREPKYTYSFRRLRKEGKLKFLRQLTKLHINIVTHGYHTNTKKDYPMGGHYFKQNPPQTTLTTKLKRRGLKALGF